MADRIAQTVVVARLEQGVEPMFHADSYGSPGTIGAGCGGLVPARCWKLDWVIDLDTQKFCDTLRLGWPTLHRLRAESHHAQRAAPDKDKECFS